jgi:AcrR family transcriptional regulator
MVRQIVGATLPPSGGGEVVAHSNEPPAEGAEPAADAERNRELILDAARQLFVELGAAAPLDEIARRAGVGIATLYRRFPTREDLVRHVVFDSFRTVLAAARQAVVIPYAADAIEVFFSELIAHRDRLVLPLLGGPLVNDPAIRHVRYEITATLERILVAGRHTGSIRTDVESIDLIMAGAFICRPLPNTPADWVDNLARRHLAVYLDGLRPGPSRPLVGPALDRHDLERRVHQVVEGGPGRASGATPRISSME